MQSANNRQETESGKAITDNDANMATKYLRNDSSQKTDLSKFSG